ncbi:MAG: hypothetical protein ACKVON_05265 [Beijerinckiaceae bacterium]
MDDREQALRRDGTLIGLALAGLVNGSQNSIWFDLLSGPIAAILSGFLFSSRLLLFYFASLTISVFTVLLAGVPAALYERSKGLKDSDTTSLTIWLLSAIVLALPAITKMAGFW